jgi:hypothetical protein
VLGDVPPRRPWRDSGLVRLAVPDHGLAPPHPERPCGDIGYLDEVLGVYRYHPGGLYSQFNEWEKLDRTRDFYLTMNANLGYQHDALIRGCLSNYFLEWAEEYVRRRERARAWRCFQRYLGGRPFNEHVTARRVLSLIARLLLPAGAPARP